MNASQRKFVFACALLVPFAFLPSGCGSPQAPDVADALVNTGGDADNSKADEPQADEQQAGEPQADQLAADAAPGTLPAMAPMKHTGPLIKPPAASTQFSFAVCGDSQGDNDTPETRLAGTDHPTFRAICQDVRAGQPKPAFVLSLGDIIRGEPKNIDDKGLGPPTIEKIESNLAHALCLAKLATVPVYNAPGNHEMDDVTNTNPWTEMPNARMHAAYERVVGPTHGAFEFGNSLFIVLLTESVPPKTVPLPEGDQEFSYVSKLQIEQLTATLEANTDKDHIFIAMHYPIHAREAPSDELYGESRTELLKLFTNKKYPISYVLASHQHLFYDHNNPIDWTVAENQVENWPDGAKFLPEFTKGDDPRYLVSGGAGARSWKQEAYTFHHYILLEVDGLNVKATVHYIPPAK